MKSNFKFGNGIKSNLGLNEENNKYDFDYKKFDINSVNDSHAAIARQINHNSLVLDIGCSSGTIGKILKNYKNCIVDGIEYDPLTIKLAQTSNAYRKLYNFSITDFNGKDSKLFIDDNNKYDYIIFGDVLEHLYCPWEVLVNISKYMKKKGKIIISLPNVSHIDIIKGLIDDNFNYREVGLLDNTHIRFFTYNTFLDMLENIATTNHIFFKAILKESTYFCPEYVNDDKIYELFNVDNALQDKVILQNIIELSLVNNKNEMSKRKNNRYFKRMNEYYEAILNDRVRLEKENSNLTDNFQNEKNKNNVLKKEINDLKYELKMLNEINTDNYNKYNEIVNSKRWKLLNKILSFFGK